MKDTVWCAQTQEAAEVATDFNKDKQGNSHRKNNTYTFIWSASKHD